MKKVLVVDDDEDILEVVELILTRNGFEVQTHPTSQNVPEIVNNYHPNLILLDVLLPGKSGTEICRDLKLSHTDLPIILFSAHAIQEKEVNRCNADGFIKKPFDMKNLIGTIKSHTDLI